MAAPGAPAAVSYRRVVVPLDGSDLAEQALPHAEALALLTGAPLHLVRVIDPAHLGTPLGALLSSDALTLALILEDERIAARDSLERIAQDLRDRGQVVTVEYQQGSAADELLAVTQPGDLLVMVTHGRGGLGRWFLGSVAETVIRRTTVPVLLVRASEMSPMPPAIQRIVVPLDGSTLAEEALPTARAMAGRLHVPVHLLTVIDISGATTLELATAAVSASRLEETLLRLFTEAEISLANAEEQVLQPGAKVTTEVRYGSPGPTIVDATQPGDLIVMTSHGHSGFARWMLGSVAEAVVRRSAVPVLLVRSAGSEVNWTARGAAA